MLLLNNKTPYQAKIYSSLYSMLPITWICVVKASFKFNNQGQLTVITPCHPIREYDTFFQYRKQTRLHYSHETMSAKQGGEFVLIWDQLHEQRRCTKVPLHVLCDNEKIHYIRTRHLNSLGYLNPTHSLCKRQNTTTRLHNVATVNQRLSHPFTGVETIEWWWGDSNITHGFKIPKIPLTLRIEHLNSKHPPKFAWDTLCIVVDLHQCHLIGRICIPSHSLMQYTRSIAIEINSLLAT